jgi:hypothetical protein
MNVRYDVYESAIFWGFQGWMADYARIELGIEGFRGIERIVRNSTIKVGIFS